MLTAGAVHARRDEPARQVATGHDKRDATRRADQTRGLATAGSTNRQPSRKPWPQRCVADATRPPQPQTPTNNRRDIRPPRRSETNAWRGTSLRHNRHRRNDNTQSATKTPTINEATQPPEMRSIDPHRVPDTAAPARRVHPRMAHATRPQRPSRQRGRDEPTARPNAGQACDRPGAAPHDADDEGRRPHREGPPRWRDEQAASAKRAAR